jgi:hypothetical protein
MTVEVEDDAKTASTDVRFAEELMTGKLNMAVLPGPPKLFANGPDEDVTVRIPSRVTIPPLCPVVLS